MDPNDFEKLIDLVEQHTRLVEQINGLKDKIAGTTPVGFYQRAVRGKEWLVIVRKHRPPRSKKTNTIVNVKPVFKA